MTNERKPPEGHDGVAERPQADKPDDRRNPPVATRFKPGQSGNPQAARRAPRDDERRYVTCCSRSERYAKRNQHRRSRAQLLNCCSWFCAKRPSKVIAAPSKHCKILIATASALILMPLEVRWSLFRRVHRLPFFHRCARLRHN